MPPAAGQHMPVNPVATHLGRAAQDPALDDDESLGFSEPADDEDDASASPPPSPFGGRGMCFVVDLTTSLVVATSPFPLP